MVEIKSDVLCHKRIGSLTVIKKKKNNTSYVNFKMLILTIFCNVNSRNISHQGFRWERNGNIYTDVYKLV